MYTAFNLTDKLVKPSFNSIETANHAVDTNNIKNITEIFKERSDLYPTFKPVIVAMINDVIAVITDARRVEQGTLNPVFATCVQATRTVQFRVEDIGFWKNGRMEEWKNSATTLTI